MGTAVPAADQKTFLTGDSDCTSMGDSELANTQDISADIGPGMCPGSKDIGKPELLQAHMLSCVIGAWGFGEDEFLRAACSTT